MTTHAILTVGLAIAALPPLAAALYLALLALLAQRSAAGTSDRPTASRRGRTRFDVLVPAHDEEAGIATTVASLLALDYPRDQFRIVVIADNCADATAARARSAGALVHERSDPLRRGKGYALAFGFTAVLADGFADAIVVVDADSTVSANLLGAFDAALGAGAAALQASYRIRNPDASWRTRLLTLGFALFHDIRSLARERMSLSCGLRGNGMCFRAELLRRVPHRAFSIVEDLEYGVQLGLAGVRVAYVGDAGVYGDMPTTSGTARSQRARWERGRRAMAREYAPRLLRGSVARRDPVLLDLLFDVLVPPLSRLVGLVIAGWACATLALALGVPAGAAVALWTTAGVALLAYVARGCALTGHGARAATDLAWAPVYMLWKLTVSAGRATRADAWVRTSRTMPANRGGQ